MKQVFFLCLVFVQPIFLEAQSVAINNDGSVAHPSAMLDIKSGSKGLLIPRINLVSDSDIATISSPRLSLLIYNTNGTLDDGEGYYFWNTNRWIKLITRNNLNKLSWNIGGNSATNPSNDFIGTSDNKPLVFKTNNVLSGKIETVSNNVFFGQSAGMNVTTGNSNSFYGQNSGISTTTGSGNLFAGHNAGASNSDGNHNIFLGQGAGKSNSVGNQNVFIGNDAGFSNTAIDEMVAVGSGALHDNIGGLANTAIGFEALYKNTSGFYNVALGSHALFNNTTASSNTAMGREALYFNSTGPSNTAYGYRALYSNTTGGSNTAMGLQALNSNTTGTQNVASGFSSMFSNTTGSYNSASGYDALWQNTTGNYNTADGYKALNSNTNGTNNTAIGREALKNNVNGSENTAIGYNALISNISGNFNTAIGYNAGYLTSSDLSNTTSLGWGATITTSNTMAFGNSSVDRWAFGLNTTNANHALEVGSNSTNGNGAYLTQGGNWVNTSSKIKKENFTNINGTELLAQIKQLPVQKWKYKGTNEYHIGPVAEDFYKTFELGTDDKGISTVDPSGIALAAIKEQQKIIESMKKEIEELKQYYWKRNKEIKNKR